jgi:TolA-binding protein
VEKVTDDSNVWLLAVRLEDEGDFQGAYKFFMKDAKEYKDKNLDSRVALSYFCAARCKSNMGQEKKAKALYRSAGDHYTNFAKKSKKSSPKDASWASAKADECYKLSRLRTED